MYEYSKGDTGNSLTVGVTESEKRRLRHTHTYVLSCFLHRKDRFVNQKLVTMCWVHTPCRDTLRHSNGIIAKAGQGGRMGRLMFLSLSMNRSNPILRNIIGMFQSIL